MAKPRRTPLSNDRRLVCDVVAIAQKTPFAPVVRTIDVGELHALRKRIRPRISWQVILMRAYAIVAESVPELRQIYVPLPYPHLYEHPESVCLLTIAREHEGRERLFFARFNQPENYSLAYLQEQFENYRRQPVETIKQLRHQVLFAKMPWWVRQIGWKLMTHWMPKGRAKLMGTFGMSLSSFRGTKGVYHLGPCTTILGYDQFCSRGQAHITLTFDHRVLDGKPAVDVLERLRRVLLGRVRREMIEMVGSDEPSLRLRTETAEPTADAETVADAGNEVRKLA